MKRLMAFALIITLLITGCGSTPSVEQPTLKTDVVLADMVKMVTDEQPLAMPSALTKEMMGDLLDLDETEVAEFAGEITLSMVSADQLILIKANPDKLDRVVQALEARCELVRQTFQDYIPAQAAKAEAGRVVTKGDYAFLIMLGDDDDQEDPDAAVDRAEELLLGCFA